MRWRQLLLIVVCLLPLCPHVLAGAIRRHLVNAMDKTVCGGQRSWEDDIAGNGAGGAPLRGTLCSPMLGRWRPIEVDWKARTTTPLGIGLREMVRYSLMYEGEVPSEIKEPHTGASEEIESPDDALSVPAMRSLLDLLHKERWDVYSQWMQLKFALKTSGGGDTYRDLFIEQSRKSPKFNQGRAQVGRSAGHQRPCPSDHRNHHSLRQGGQL